MKDPERKSGSIDTSTKRGGLASSVFLLRSSPVPPMRWI
jgi:hypothetical protein